LGTTIAGNLPYRFLMGTGYLIRAVVRDGIISIRYCEDPREEGDLLSLQAIGITFPVPTFVMVTNDLPLPIE